MILDACKRGVAAVVVTHDAHLASWADRVVFLRDGRCRRPRRTRRFPIRPSSRPARSAIERTRPKEPR